jgi:hypothetical protein
MTKPQILDVLMLLSALESWGYSTGSKLPEYLSESITSTIEDLRGELLESDK